MNNNIISIHVYVNIIFANLLFKEILHYLKSVFIKITHTLTRFFSTVLKTQILLSKNSRYICFLILTLPGLTISWLPIRLCWICSNLPKLSYAKTKTKYDKTMITGQHRNFLLRIHSK